MPSEARIGIKADTKQAEAGVKSVQGLFRGLQAEAKQSILTGVGLGAGVAGFNLLGGAVQGVTSFLKDSVGAASALAESQGKVNVVFGKSAEKITAWAATASSAFGQSKQQALEAAGTYGNLFRAFGFTEDAATGMSQKLVELAADLASFNNTSIDDALLALRSGLSGETEPLKRYGIALSDARMRQELLAQGMTNLGTTLTPLQKTTAAYALIMKDSALAQGDFARTSDGLANTQRALEADMADLSAEIGEKLLPIMLELAKFARDVLIPAVRAIGGAIGEVVKVMGDIGQAWATVGLDFGSMGDRIHRIARDTGSDFDTVKAGIKDLMLESGKSFDEAATTFEMAGREFVDSSAKVREAGGQMAAGVVEDMSTMSGHVVAIVRQLPGKMADALRANRDNWRNAMETLAEDSEDTLSRSAEKAALLGALHGKELARGLADSRPLVRADAQALQLEIAKALIAANVPFHQWGMNIGAAWALGVRTGLLNNQERMRQALVPYKEYLQGESPPKKGPLKDIDKGGFNIGKAWAGGFGKGIGTANLGLSVPGASGSLAAVGVGGGPVTIQLQVDGRTLAEIVDRNLYYRQSGASRLPLS